MCAAHLLNGLHKMLQALPETLNGLHKTLNSLHEHFLARNNMHMVAFHTHWTHFYIDRFSFQFGPLRFFL